MLGWPLCCDKRVQSLVPARPRFQGVRPNPDDPRAIPRVGAALTGLTKEVNTSLGPIHPARAIRKLARAANATFEIVQYRIEPDQCLRRSMSIYHVSGASNFRATNF